MATSKRRHIFNMPSHFQVKAALHFEQAERASQLVGAIPLDELPDGDDRTALADAVTRGDVEDIYQPCAANYHNATIPGLPSWVDPRLKVKTWAQWRREGRDIRATMIADARARADAAQG
jgi:hypothetical protein